MVMFHGGEGVRWRGGMVNKYLVKKFVEENMQTIYATLLACYCYLGSMATYRVFHNLNST